MCYFRFFYSRMAAVKVNHPKFGFRQDSPFTTEQSTFIILKYGEVKNTTLVRRFFRMKFFPKNPKQVPQNVKFQRVIDRFLRTASVRQSTPAGLPPTPAEDIQAVKDFFQRNPKAHLRAAMVELNLPIGKIWMILRKNLKFKPYRPHTSQMLSPANMESRLAASNFFLTFSEDQLEKVLWSDEKWFVLHQAPNRKNDVIWGPQNTRNVGGCKKAHQAKVMA